MISDENTVETTYQHSSPLMQDIWVWWLASLGMIHFDSFSLPRSSSSLWTLKTRLPCWRENILNPFTHWYSHLFGGASFHLFISMCCSPTLQLSKTKKDPLKWGLRARGGSCAVYRHDKEQAYEQSLWVVCVLCLLLLLRQGHVFVLCLKVALAETDVLMLNPFTEALTVFPFYKGGSGRW